MIKFEQTKSAKYAPRTYHNATSAQLTLAFAQDFFTAGELLTKKAAGSNYKAIQLSSLATDLDDVAFSIVFECKRIGARSLNIAGNSLSTLSKYGYSQQQVNQLIYDVLSKVHLNFELYSIVSGGQTGVDWAGGVAAYALNINCVMTFPAGFLQRNIDGIDFVNDESSLFLLLHNQAKALVRI